MVTRAAEAHLARVLPIAAVTKGLAGAELTDFAALREAGAVAFSDDGMPIMDPGIMRRALQEGLRVGGTVIALLDRAKDVVIGKAAATTAAAGVAATVVVGGVMISGNGPNLQLAGDPPVIRETPESGAPSTTKQADLKREESTRPARERTFSGWL